MIDSGADRSLAVEAVLSDLQGRTVHLALDGVTTTTRLRSRSNVLTPEDLVDVDAILAFEAAARTAVDDFLRTLSGGPAITMVLGPAAVPTIDRAMLVRWLTRALTARRAVELLSTAGVDVARGQQASTWDPTRYEHTNADDLSRVLTPITLGSSAPRIAPHTERPSIGAAPRMTLERMQDLIARRSARSTRLARGSVVAAMFVLEMTRHADELADLANHRLPLVLVPFDGPYRSRYRKARKLSGKLGHPALIPIPVRRRARARHAATLSASVERARTVLDCGARPPDDPLRLLGVVAPMLAGRWAAMTTDWEQWRDLWSRTAPALVVTARSTPGSSIPLHAAAAVEVPAVSLPHAMAEPGLELPGHPLVRHLTPFAVSGSDRSDGWVATPHAVLDREYRRAIEALPRTSVTARPHVLILVDPSALLGRGALRSLRSLRALMGFIRQHPKLGFVLKDHPSNTLVADLVADDAPENLHIAGPRTCLHASLEQCSAVLLFEYAGSAALHAAGSGRPLARLDLGGHFEVSRSAVDRRWLTFIDRLPLLSGLSALDEFLAGVVGNLGTSGPPDGGEALEVFASFGPSISEVAATLGASRGR